MKGENTMNVRNSPGASEGESAEAMVTSVTRFVEGEMQKRETERKGRDHRQKIQEPWEEAHLSSYSSSSPKINSCYVIL